MNGWMGGLMLIGSLMVAGCSTTATTLTYDAARVAPVTQPAKALVESAVKSDGRDNTTAIVVRVN